ncbi:MAG: hypothetical protein ACTSRG_21855 [Candidatus Helarchaeota archaeon]
MSYDDIEKQISAYIQEQEEVYKNTNINIKKMSKKLKINKKELINLLIEYCKENDDWFIDKKNKMLFKTFKGGFHNAILIERQGGGFTFGVYNIEVGAKWKKTEFELKCSRCSNKNKNFVFNENFSRNGLLFCSNCNSTLKIIDFGKYFSTEVKPSIDKLKDEEEQIEESIDTFEEEMPIKTEEPVKEEIESLLKYEFKDFLPLINVEQLKLIAKIIEIPKYSRFRKEELVDSINQKFENVLTRELFKEILSRIKFRFDLEAIANKIGIERVFSYDVNDLIEKIVDKVFW